MFSTHRFVTGTAEAVAYGLELHGSCRALSSFFTTYLPAAALNTQYLPLVRQTRKLSRNLFTIGHAVVFVKQLLSAHFFFYQNTIPCSPKVPLIFRSSLCVPECIFRRMFRLSWYGDYKGARGCHSRRQALSESSRDTPRDLLSHLMPSYLENPNFFSVPNILNTVHRQRGKLNYSLYYGPEVI